MSDTTPPWRTRRGPSLLTRRPHTVTVTPRERTRGAGGDTLWVDLDPVEVRGTVQPLSAEESYQLGLTSEVVYRFLTVGPWPGGVHSRISWDGREWEQLGEALHHTTGRLTRHIVVRLRAKGAEAR